MALYEAGEEERAGLLHRGALEVALHAVARKAHHARR
jgi:hypothetical protein